MQLTDSETAQIKACLVQVLHGYRVAAREIHRCLAILNDSGDGMRLAKQIITELTQTEGAQAAETSRKMPIDLTGRDLYGNPVQPRLDDTGDEPI